MSNEMTPEKESWLQPGVTKTKAALVYAGAILVLMSGTLCSQGINQIQTSLLTKYDGMQYFALLSALNTMGMVIMMPIGGKLSDLYGRKLLMWIGGILFTAGSVLTSFAPNLVSFLLLRSIIPFGQACTMVVAYTVMAGIFKGKGRNMAYSILSGVLAIGMFLGGTIAGYLSDAGLSWLAITYPGILLFIGVIMITSQITNVKREGKIYIDFPGMVFLVITVVGMIYAANFGAKAGWTSPIILVSLAAFVIGLICFIMVEKKSPEPILAVHMFKNPVVVGILLITIFTVMYQRPMQVYIPLILQKIVGMTQGASGLVSGARSLTNVIFPTIIAAWLVKNLDKRIWKVLFLCGVTIAGAFFIICNTGVNTSVMIFYISYGLMGIAESCKAAVVTPFLQSVVDPKDIGAATSLNSFFGTAGSAIATCIVGLYYNAAVPDPNDLDVLQSGLNSMFFVTAFTGVIIMALAVFFVRTSMAKAAEKKLQATGNA